MAEFYEHCDEPLDSIKSDILPVEYELLEKYSAQRR
jgi:hypothetical protein